MCFHWRAGEAWNGTPQEHATDLTSCLDNTPTLVCLICQGFPKHWLYSPAASATGSQPNMLMSVLLLHHILLLIVVYTFFQVCIAETAPVVIDCRRDRLELLHQWFTECSVMLPSAKIQSVPASPLTLQGTFISLLHPAWQHCARLSQSASVCAPAK